jgi:hypothetical protein
MAKKLAPAWKRTLRPMAERIWRELRCMSDVDLQHIAAAGDAADETNCWWVEYRLATALARLAKDELAFRVSDRSGEAIETAKTGSTGGESAVLSESEGDAQAPRPLGGDQ